MVGETDATLTGILKLLLALNKEQGKTCKVQGLVEQLASPYRGNIVGALANLGLIKWEAKGIYSVGVFEPNSALAIAVRSACIQATSKGKAKNLTPLMEYKPKPTEVTREIIREPSNPFGFMSFDEIMIEKGTIVIGEYTLTGSFTLKRNIK